MTLRTVIYEGVTAAPTLPSGDASLTAGNITPVGASVQVIYSLTQYNPNKVWSVTHTTARTTLSAAVTNNGYHSVTISRTGGLVPKAVRIKAARGGASTPRGFGVRSSVDSYTADLVTADIATARAVLTQYASADLTSLGTQTSITFRIYHYAPTATAAVDLDDFEFDYDDAPGGGGDTTAPTVPTGVAATSVAAPVITWTASTDAVGVSSYRIRRDGVDLTGATALTGLTYTDTSASASTTYSYTVSAVDAAGNRSNESTAASATTPAGSGGATKTVAWRGDTAAATLPSGGDASLTASSVTAGAGATLEIPYVGTAYDPNKVWQVIQSGTTARTTIADSVTNNVYVEVTVNRTGGWVPKAVRVKAAKGGATNARGFALRSSHDSYAADLITDLDVDSLRPTLTQYGPADLSAWGTKNAAVTFRLYHFAGAVANSLEFDDLEIDYEAPGGATPTLVHRAIGIPSGTEVPISARTTAATSVRAQCSTSATFASGIISGSAVTPNAQGDSQLTVTGLTAGTSYYWRVGMTVSGTETFSTISAQPFKTDNPGVVGDFAFCFGSCDDAVDVATWSTMAARNDDFFLHLGDWFHDTTATSYADGTGNGVANLRTQFVKKLQATNHAALYSKTPMSFTPSDHDTTINGATGSSDATGYANLNQVVREVLPLGTLPTSGFYKTWTRNRVRFIQIDTRTFKATGTALGATQKQWLKDTITAATEPAIFIVQPDSSWIGSGDADQWSGYTTERTELANFFAASGKAIHMLGGDSHALAGDNGTNAPGGIAYFQAAPFSNASSQKGGPFTVGPYPASGTAVVEQYGRVVVTDNGSQITVVFTGYSSDNTQRVTLTETISTVTAVTSSASDTWAVRAPIAGSRADTFAVRAPVAAAKSDLWSVRAQLLSLASDTYAVRSSVAPVTRSDTWAVRAVAAASQGDTYAVRTPISQTRTDTYGVRAAVSQLVSESFAVRALAASIRSDTYAVRFAVEKAVSDAFNVLGLEAVSATRSDAWAVRSPVANAATDAWAVRAPVVATRAEGYAVRAPVLQARSDAYAVRVAVLQTRGDAWAVAGDGVTSSRSDTYGVRAVVTGTASDAWAVFRPVAAATRTDTYSVRSAVAQTRADTWSVRAVITGTAADDWAVLAGLSVTTQDAWDVLAAIQLASSDAWSVRALAWQEVSDQWDTAASSIQFRIAVSTTMGRIWDVVTIDSNTDTVAALAEDSTATELSGKTTTAGWKT